MHSCLFCRRGGGLMSRQILESDWKLLRQIYDTAFDRYCERAVSEIQVLASGPAASHHERFLAVSRRVRELRKEMADAFDDLRRSTALFRLASLRSLGLRTEEEFAPFPPETRGVVQPLTPAPPPTFRSAPRPEPPG